MKIQDGQRMKSEFIKFPFATSIGPICLETNSNPNEKILAFGNSEDTSFTLTRLHSDGRPDEDFGVKGTVYDRFDSEVEDDVFFGISSHIENDKIFLFGILWEKWDLALARFTLDGKPDPTFGVNGKKIIEDLSKEKVKTQKSDGMNLYQKTSHFQSQTKSTMVTMPLPGGGYLILPDGADHLLFLKDNGDLDKKFTPTPPDTSNFVLRNAMLIGRKIVMIGKDDASGIVARYDLNEKIDTSFGNDGIARIKMQLDDKVDLRGMSPSLDGNYLNIVGLYTPAGTNQALLTRIDSNGTIDSSFNSGEPVTFFHSGYHVNFWFVSSRTTAEHKDDEEHIYVVGRVIPGPNYVLASYDAKGVPLHAPKIEERSAYPEGLLALAKPDRLLICGSAKKQDSFDNEGFVIFIPLPVSATL